MNWQGVSADLSVALIMMIGAAILGGLIIWLIKQWGIRSLKAKYDQKVGEYSELSNQHQLLSTQNGELEANFNKLNATHQEVQDKYNLQRRQLQDCSQKRSELESEVTLLSPFKRKYENLVPKYEGSVKELDEIRIRVKSLDVRNTGLEDALRQQREENKALNLNLVQLKAKENREAKPGESTDDGDKKGKESEKEILARIKEKASQINYERIGVATLKEKNDLKLIKGIGSFIEKKLNTLKIFTFRQIANFTTEDEDNVTDAIEFFPGRINRDNWVYQAKKLMGSKDAREAATLERIKSRAEEINFDRIGTATMAEMDDLKRVKGIGPFIEKKLHSIGIYTFRQISRFTAEDEDKVNEVIEFFPGRIRRDKWAVQAGMFAQAKKEKEGS